MDPDPGGPKTFVSGSGSPTLVSSHRSPDTLHFKVTFAVPAQPATERSPWPARPRGQSATAAEQSRKNSSTAEKSRKTSPAADFWGQRSPDGGCRWGANQRRSGGGVPEVQGENGSAHPEREGETTAIRVQDQAAHSPRRWYVNLRPRYIYLLFGDMEFTTYAWVRYYLCRTNAMFVTYCFAYLFCCVQLSEISFSLLFYAL